jgi:hypothetical protein
VRDFEVHVLEVVNPGTANHYRFRGHLLRRTRRSRFLVLAEVLRKCQKRLANLSIIEQSGKLSSARKRTPAR